MFTKATSELGAAIMSAVSVNKRLLVSAGSVLSHVSVRRSSQKQGEAPVPWEGSSVCALSPRKCLPAHCRGHLLCRVPLGTATTCLSPAGTDS